MGWSIGDKILVETNGHSYDATFVKGYSGIGVMGAYMSIADDASNQHVSFGAFNVKIWGHPDMVEQAGSFDWSVIDDYVFDLKEISLKYLKEYAGMSDDEINRVIDRVAK